MGVKVDMDANIEKLISDLEKKTIENIKKRIDEETPKVEEKALNLVERKLNEFYEISVLNFYNHYQPKFYQRRDNGSLYNLFRTKRNGTKLDYWFEPSEITSRTGYDGEDGLYKTVFKEGWHGGANINGEMLVPYRIPPQTYDGDKKPYQKGKAKWKPAVRAPFSPYDMFIALKEDYQNNGYERDYKKLWVDHLNSIGIKVR